MRALRPILGLERMGKRSWLVLGFAWLAVTAAVAYAAPPFLVPIGFFTMIVAAALLLRGGLKREAQRAEALFARLFPDLQPWYHRKRLHDFTAAREVVRILDASGGLVTQFTFERLAEGAAIRLGKGKFTVATRSKANPRVRYWHPDREFKWTPASWKLKTPGFEHSFVSRNTGSAWSDSTSSKSRGVPE